MTSLLVPALAILLISSRYSHEASELGSIEIHRIRHRQAIIVTTYRQRGVETHTIEGRADRNTRRAKHRQRPRLLEIL